MKDCRRRMTTAHVFTTSLASNFFCCCFCRSAFTEGAFPTPSCEGYWRGKGKESAKDLPSFLISLVSLVNCTPSPEMWPCTITVKCDCSYRLPSRYYLPFPSAREVEITGRTFLLEQTWFQAAPKECNGHRVTWLNVGLQIKESEIFDGGMEQDEH